MNINNIDSEKIMAEEKNMDKIDFEESAPETDASESDHKDKKEKRSEVKKLKTEIEDLKKALEAEKARADETNDKYLRLAAEYDNFRKRTQADRKNIYTDAVSETLGGLLPTIDNLQYAAKYSGGDAEKVAEVFIEAFDEDSVMLIPGGQPVYYYIISVE